jgi:putative endonuclease
MSEPWVLYWLACAREKSYVGITNNLVRRYQQHQAGRGGKFTRAFRPTRILGVQPFPDRAAATRAERQLKAQTRAGKQEWARQWPFIPEPGPGVDPLEPCSLREN